MDWRVLAFTLAVALITGILFGLVPAFAASRTDLSTTLKESSSRSGSGFRQGKTRSLLIVTEVALALVLLIGSTLLIRTFIALRAVSPGFDAHNVLTLEMSMTGARLHTALGVSQLSKQGRDRLNAIPGVELAATSVWLPNQVDDGLPFQILGRPVDKSKAGGRFTSISPGFLEVFKIPLLRGRDINETDIAGHPGVVLINQALADQNWPNWNHGGEDPVGQHIFIGGDIGPTFAGETARIIIGIVANTHNNGLGNPPDGMMIVPTAQVPDGYQGAYSDTSPLAWVVRTHADPHQLIPTITEQLRIASNGFPVTHIRTMDEVIGRSTPRESFNMLLLTLFAAVALLLAAIGIYALMAYSAAQRHQEMGIRIALGADRSAVRRLIVWSGMKMAFAGILLGIAASFALTRLLASLLFHVRPWDPVAFISAPLILAAVALIAVWLPGTRASAVDPMQALRSE
jgi:putative ABC transport system permease protein